MKILIIGSNGMLGHSLYRYFNRCHQVIGVSRGKPWNSKIRSGYDVNNITKFDQLFSIERPDLVLNCVGIIKQIKDSTDNEISIKTNALWPHELATICRRYSSKMIHFSTDCVFSGRQGNYDESSIADSRDLYGLSKYLGEVHYDHTLTLRTSIIGHELNSNVSLVDWFLSQKGHCKGFTNAIYSGFPTNSLARIIDKFVLPKFLNDEVNGLYHLSSEPINKFDLLMKISKKYQKEIEILPDKEFVIDRSLSSTRFKKTFGFTPDSWDDLIDEMYELYQEVEGIK